MKRNHEGGPAMMVHRWNRLPLSCASCREKKRRCDRNQPCSNCTLRNIQCEYTTHRVSDESVEAPISAVPSVDAVQYPNTPVTISRTPPRHVQSLPPIFNAEEVLQRLHSLEEAVFDKPRQATRELGAESSNLGDAVRLRFTPFRSCLSSSLPIGDSLSTIPVARYLPPVGEARELFKHFSLTLQPMYGVLHIPSTREMMEQTYEQINQGSKLEMSNLLLLLSVFAGSALAPNPQLLRILGVTQSEAVEVSNIYTRLAMFVLDDPQCMTPSTVALAALETLNHVITSSEGPIRKVPIIQARRFQMIRAMQIRALDSLKNIEERRNKGCNHIEVEVQRRIWWNMVSSDWLTSFAGGPFDGTYVFHPSQMKVDYPSNVDDEFVTQDGILREFPLSTPTSMCGFVHRIKLADICREIVDSMPSVFLESNEPDYETILAFDKKLQNYLKDLPVFFKLDPVSIQQSEPICKERPIIPFKRLNVHFSVHTRLCQLHRPYHLKGMTNLKYAYSHMMCVHSAQTVLELRRSMEDVAMQAGVKPARYWRIMQHVFIAALLLATDLSFNPNGPGAESRRAQVLTAYETLERSDKEPGARMEGLRTNMQTLMIALQKHRSEATPAQLESTPLVNYHSYDQTLEALSTIQPSEKSNKSLAGNNVEITDNITSSDASQSLDKNFTEHNNFNYELRAEDGNWDSLWSEFLTVAPDLDIPQWNSLLQDMDSYLNQDIN
ncbi:hypothetical protein F5884DRAFT_806245 [Xylogone sp. PMI_703]|nr:hypothetical protein F5884DRAFT_806245 [Xylogone sp. PMI_703]